VDEAFVVQLLHRTRGTQYFCAPHDWDHKTMVHVFRPDVAGRRWYVKAYFLDPMLARAVFISVHE
jgi:hypothetical protein